MTTLDDLLLEIGRLYMENVMLRRLIEEAQQDAPVQGQEEKNEST